MVQWRGDSWREKVTWGVYVGGGCEVELSLSVRLRQRRSCVPWSPLPGMSSREEVERFVGGEEL